MNAEDIFDDEGLRILDLDRMAEGDVEMMMADEEQHAAAALALEVAGIREGARIPGALASSRARAVGGQRVSGLESASSTRSLPRPADLLRVAKDNASMYSPKWASASQLGGRMRGSNSIEIGQGDLVNVAHAPKGLGEGRAVRALTPLPRRQPASAAANSDGNTPQKVFGFRVAFHSPHHEAGTGMGGCYLVGVTSSSFTAYGERNGLQQSPYFWGIEDGGCKFEGPRPSHTSSRTGMRRSSSNYGIDMTRSEARRNADGVLFGCEEVITVVADMENRTLSYWRDEELLGTLVTNLPRSGPLFPVAVPFNSGVSVAITDVNGDPLPCLERFDSYWNNAQEKKATLRLQQLAASRAILIDRGEPTPRLVKALENIFASYESHNASIPSGDVKLDMLQASRLWYRFGFNLENLFALVESRPSKTLSLHETTVSFQDFLLTIKGLIHEDESHANSFERNSDVKVGDVVELVDEYIKYGDAATGPMHRDERGRVIEVQEGTSRERQIRVLCRGQRWWYQAHALLTERSGLIDSAGVWFLRRGLRSHGYDATALSPIGGCPVSPTNWEIGDIVVPKSRRGSSKSQEDSSISLASNSCFGRLVPNARNLVGQGERRGRESGMVLVQFMDPSFGVTVGTFSSSRDEASTSICERQVRANKLVYASCRFDDASKVGTECTDADNASIDIPTLSDSIKKDLAAVQNLDQAAIDSITKECKKSIASLASLFEAGISDSILSAIDEAERKLLHSGTDITGPLVSLNLLVKTIIASVFPGDSSNVCEDPNVRNISGQPSPPAGISPFGSEPNATELAALRQRRTMLLRLMGRNLSGNTDSRSSETLDHRGSGVGARSNSVDRRLRPSVAELNEFEDVLLRPRRTRQAQNRTRAQESGAGGRAETAANAEATVSWNHLETFIRGRRYEASAGSSEVDITTSPTLGAAISTSLLDNNFEWLEKTLLLLEPVTRDKGIDLCNSFDEAGMSLLLLAIHLGCSSKIVRHLVRGGALIGRQEIEAAAKTSQSVTLSILLQHFSYSVDIETSHWPLPSVSVFEKASLRRKLQQGLVAQKGSVLASSLIQKLCQLGVLCHRHQSPEAEQCLKVVSDTLVGNLLLTQMSKVQQSAMESNTQRNTTTSRSQSNSEMERVSLSQYESSVGGLAANSLNILSAGLLSVIPVKTLEESLFGEGAENKIVTTVLSFVEASLWSKESYDSSVGISCLASLLKGGSKIGWRSAMKRFGFRRLVASHETLAKRSLSELQSRLPTKTRSSASAASANSAASNDGPTDHCGVVLCRENHVAELHLTRHSSFRCDLCGRGIDRGQPMYGCRTCDWDACEVCTDRGEGGIAKWRYILDLASECVVQLSSIEEEGSVAMQIEGAFDVAPMQDRESDLKRLASRLREYDTSALIELKTLLLSPSLLTVNEFAMLILPALYAAIVVDDSSLSGRATRESQPMRRNKKQRLRGSFHDTQRSSESRSENKFSNRDAFCRRLFVDLLDSSGRGEEVRPIHASLPAHASDDDIPRLLRRGSRSVENEEQRKVPELLFKLRQILSFSEGVSLFETMGGSSRVEGRAPVQSSLQSLTDPFEVELIPFSNKQGSRPGCATSVLAEPLMPLSELQRHILRACRCNDRAYLDYCQSLADHRDIIIERPASTNAASEGGSSCGWQLAQITAYDEKTGSHTIRYASRLRHERDVSTMIFLRRGDAAAADIFEFDGQETALVLAAREYYLLREEPFEVPCESMDTDIDNGETVGNAELYVKKRAETTCSSSSSSGSTPCTILSQYHQERAGSSSAVSTTTVYDIVTDTGEIHKSVEESQIRLRRSDAPPDRRSRYRALNRSFSEMRRDAGPGGSVLVRSMLPLWARRAGLDPSGDPDNRFDAAPTDNIGVLKRSWSALSPLNEMDSLDLPVVFRTDAESTDSVEGKKWTCSVGGKNIVIFAENGVGEKQPQLRVKFSVDECLPAAYAPSDSNDTLFSLLSNLFRSKEAFGEDLRRQKKLFYAIQWNGEEEFAAKQQMNRPDDLGALHVDLIEPELARKAIEYSESAEAGLCEGLDLTSMQCMELLNELARLVEECLPVDLLNTPSSSNVCPSPAMFCSETLTAKLEKQLEDSLVVVGGALPDWAFLGPAFTPRVFSYESRRLLLQRTAFGVSRAALKQQEAKVAVGPLRQRMAALRGRAVELVGEAFSGGAEDPTALQLQADELYGMEEALSARVNAAFRAQRWRELSLQSAKVAVRRERLLADAEAAMNTYASDSTACRRRLEVRFEGESGFDAASGNEAGVTRGFYADVAEGLLSTDHVSSLHCMVACPSDFAQVASIEESGTAYNALKLPLWIPDMDTGRLVIIPTPRADPSSSIGVFPRPLSPVDPVLDGVCKQFRFIGRLFAAAMRDGFMFPLPLSCAFLRLVQMAGEEAMFSPKLGLPSHCRFATSASASAADEMSISDNSTVGTAIGLEATLASYLKSSSSSRCLGLTSLDLPRPGFLGGEVYAVEMFICDALAKLDAADPPLSKTELERRRKEIASDKDFARSALGKSYDCSFEDYFQDRTFVDPLDPSQGEDAYPLCPNGHIRQVTICNVQEWVTLAKEFILHSGVIEQARAFRRGIEDFFSADYLNIFTPKELQRDVCGGSDNVDKWDESAVRALFKLDAGTEALVAVAAIGGEGGASLSRRFSPSSPTIRYLIKTLLESTPTQRRQFLSFVTSVPIVTPGKIEIVPTVSPLGEFMPMQDPSCLPRANTCSRRLYLPKFEDYASFKRVLQAVIREESRFKGFYEWRG